MKRICIVGISGKLGLYMTKHALARGYEVTGVCRPESVGKLARFEGRVTRLSRPLRPSRGHRAGHARVRRRDPAPKKWTGSGRHALHVGR